MSWLWQVDGWQHQFALPGKRPILLLLLGLILGFAFIRTSTRLIRAQVRWWPGNVTAGGVHLHHEFFGMLILLTSGTIAFAIRMEPPWGSVLAFIFGVGGGLVLDEFALLLHLQDDYWQQAGQASIDAVIVAIAFTALLVVGVVPFGLGEVSDAETSSRWLAVGLTVALLALPLTCAVKGKPWLTLISVLVPLIGLIGAIRLAAPDSPWAHRRYGSHPHKQARAVKRGAFWDARKRRLITAIGGKPDPQT